MGLSAVAAVPEVPTFFLVWIVIVLCIAFGPKLWNRYQDHRATTWPSASIKIISTSVEEKRERNGPSYVAELNYTYSVDGTMFRGQYKRSFADPEEAEQFALRLRNAQAMTHVKPNKPSVSRVLTEELDTVFESLPPVALPEPLPPYLAMPAWLRPMLLVAIAWAMIGLALSLWVHVNALLGGQVLSDSWFAILHVGIFVIWFPAVYAQTKITGRIRKDTLSFPGSFPGVPTWLKYTVYGFFVYAIVNFAHFMIFTDTAGKAPGSAPSNQWRGFSGHWMLFYAAGWAMLWSAYTLSDPRNREPSQKRTTGF